MSDKLPPLPSVNTSFSDILESDVPPVFSTVIVYTIVSPAPVLPSPLSITAAVFVASTPGNAVILTRVGSSLVLPSLSSPSSEVSVTSLVFPGEDAVTTTVLDVPPASTAACVIVYDAI